METSEKEAEEAVQISQSLEPEESGEEIELGDIIKIIGGRWDNLVGRIYYRDGELIRILPENLSDTLKDITIGDEGIDPDLGIEELVIIYKRTKESFVELFDFHVNSPVETFDKNGVRMGKFTIQSIDEKNDSIVLLDEIGSENNIEFNFIGIPLDAPFAVLRVLDPIDFAKNEDEEDEEEENEEASDAESEYEVINLKQTFDIPDEIKEIPVFQRIYPDIIQKTDFFQDILSYLDPKDKRNEKNVLKIRNRIELFIRLRNEIIEYSADGNNAIQKASSIGTIYEITKLQNVPLLRPILDVKRVLYYDYEPSSDDNVEIPSNDQSIIKLFDKDLMNAEEYASQFFGQAILPGSVVNELPHFYAFISSYIDKFNRPWMSLSTDYVFQTDSEFFRRIIPFQEDSELLSGYNHVGPYKEPRDLLTYESISTNLSGSLLRGLGPTDRRVGNQPAPYINSEKAGVLNFLLFPYERSGPFSVKRSGSLLYDIESSKQRFKSIEQIFKNTEVGEEPTSTSIMLIGGKGTTLGNISLDEYFKSLILSGFGITDFLPLLRSLGLANKELTVGQQEIFIAAIERTIEAVKRNIAEKRAEIGKTEVAAVEVIELIPGFREILDDVFNAEPILKQEYEKFSKIFPEYQTSDIAVFTFINNAHPDLLDSALGGQSLSTGLKRLRAIRNQYLNQLRIAKASVESDKMKGLPPMPNRCEHVGALRTIRKLKDNDQRLSLLVRFVAKYQGSRKEQWINCRICKEHLICGHELLQITQYSKPREKKLLQKELLLNFGGGQFQGKYQCRNCGQSLGELEFDTNLEFDDDGRPMVGRAVLENEDVLTDSIDLVLSKDVQSSIEYTDESKKLIYNVSKQIAQIVGINIDEAGYRSIVERTASNINRLETREEYIKKQGKSKIKYDPYMNTSLISITTCAILLEIETHIPDYIIRYTIPGCVASFTGWPLNDKDDMSSIEYMGCAIASITRNEHPWNDTIYLRQSYSNKIKIIGTLLVNQMEKMIEEPTPVQLLNDKKDYYKKLYGRETLKPSDIIPEGFLPKQVIFSLEEEAAEPAISNISADVASRIWIRESHRRAKSTALLISGSPYVETGCCFVNVRNPGQYWNSGDGDDSNGLPKLHMNKPTGITNTNIAIRYKERIEEPLKADLDNFLELFVKVCFKGERMGHPHEVNMLHKCDWCDFQFPKDPQLLTPEETEAAFASQDIDTSIDAYQELLDITRRVNKIPKEVLKDLPDINSLFLDMTRLDPPPCEGWAERLSQILKEIQSLGREYSQIDIATAYGPISNIVSEANTYLATQLSKGNIETIKEISEMPVYSLKQIIQTYMIVPLERIITNYTSDHLKVQKYYKLHYLHVQDIEKMIHNHTNFLKEYIDALEPEFIYAKVKYFLDQIQGLFKMESVLQEKAVPGGSLGLQYLVKGFILCPLAELLDPHKIPPTFNAEQTPLSAVSTSMKGPHRIIVTALALFRKEGLSYNATDIKLAIEARSEKEKMGIIMEMDKMSKDEKQTVLMQKRLGIGRWAVGGTNSIWKYNAQRYEIEREEREKAGIIDFNAGIEEEMQVFVAGQGLNEFMGRSGPEAGYDVGQMAEEDY